MTCDIIAIIAIPYFTYLGTYRIQPSSGRKLHPKIRMITYSHLIFLIHPSPASLSLVGLSCHIHIHPPPGLVLWKSQSAGPGNCSPAWVLPRALLPCVGEDR